MEAYTVNDEEAVKSGKVDAGNIHDGTDILGYRISAGSRQPSAAACRALLGKLDKVVADCNREMKAAAMGNSNSHLNRYHQSLVLMHEIIWGWSQAFRYTTAVHVFESLDRQIDKRIAALNQTAREIVGLSPPHVRRRVIGVHLLADTQSNPLL